MDDFLAAMESTVKAMRVGDPLDESDRDGAADLGRPARDGGVLRPRRRSGGVPRGDPRRPRLLVPADGAGAGVERRPRRARGDLRAGRLRDPVRRRGRGGPPRQRHDLRPLGLGLDRRRRPGAAGRPRDRDRRDLDQLEQLGPGDDARSAASSSPGVGRELGPDALDHYTEVKNVYYATERGDSADGTARRQGLRDHRRGQRHRRRVGARVRRRGRARRRRRPGAGLAEGELAIEADVTDEEQVGALYERVRDELGSVDVLFNNAGINPERRHHRHRDRRSTPGSASRT